MALQKEQRIDVDEIQIDALTEILNVGVGAAASVLSELVNATVTLTVPHLELKSFFELKKALGERSDPNVVAIHQGISGEFPGEAFLVFPEACSLELVRSLLQEDVTLEELPDVESEAMSELGNIILNACIGTMANQIDRRVEVSLPHFIRGDISEIMPGSPEDQGGFGVGLLLYVDFSIESKGIGGYIVLTMTIESAQVLFDAVQGYLKEVGAA